MPVPVKAASVALFADGEVLLILRAKAPYAGYWTLPGGKLEAGERPEDAARREIAEELGLMPGPLHEVTTLAYPGAPQFGLRVFAARMPQGVPLPSDEIADWQFHDPLHLAGLRTSPGLAAVLARALEVIASG